MKCSYKPEKQAIGEGNFRLQSKRLNGNMNTRGIAESFRCIRLTWPADICVSQSCIWQYHQILHVICLEKDEIKISAKISLR